MLTLGVRIHPGGLKAGKPRAGRSQGGQAQASYTECAGEGGHSQSGHICAEMNGIDGANELPARATGGMLTWPMGPAVDHGTLAAAKYEPPSPAKQRLWDSCI